MKRTKLRSIIQSAAIDAECTPHEVTRLVDTARDIDKVLVGNFTGKVDGQECGCPATLAGFFDPDTCEWTVERRENGTGPRSFPTHFDSHFAVGAAPHGSDRTSTRFTEDGYIEYIEVTD